MKYNGMPRIPVSQVVDLNANVVRPHCLCIPFVRVVVKRLKYSCGSFHTMTTEAKDTGPRTIEKPAGFAILQIVLIPVIAALNYVTGVIINILKLPLFMDTWATMFGTIVAGIWVGAAGGFLYNIIMAFTLWGLPAWVWGFINIFIAFITWVLWRIGWVTVKSPLKLVLAGIIIGVLNVIPVTIINWGVFGLLPTYAGTAWIYAGVLASTGSAWTASIVSSIIAEIPDKLISLILAAVVASRMPARFTLRPPKA
jgi:energy-coupling factor transport system substrate-specific component